MRDRVPINRYMCYKALCVYNITSSSISQAEHSSLSIVTTIYSNSQTEINFFMGFNFKLCLKKKTDKNIN